MHLDPNLLRNLVIVLFLVALFGGKIAKGRSRETAEGLVFPMKPVFTAMRFFALPHSLPGVSPWPAKSI